MLITHALYVLNFRSLFKVYVHSRSNLLQASHAMAFLTLKSWNESGICDSRYLNVSTRSSSFPERDLMESEPGMLMVSS